MPTTPLNEKDGTSIQLSHDSKHTNHAQHLRMASNSSSDTDDYESLLREFKASNLAPFHIRWIRGFNHKVGVINLNYHGSTIAFYAASNCGVLYNWTMHSMEILQGHRHMVTCIASDEKGNWLVTADSGPENLIIIWDRKDLFPSRTIFSPHGTEKISKLAISSDAKYLLTLAYSGHSVQIKWWIWSDNWPGPHALIEIELDKDSIIEMSCNPFRSEEFCLMTKSNIWIGIAAKIKIIEREVLKITDNWELILTRPLIKINPDYGKHVCFTFVHPTRQILVGTNHGAIILYGYTLEYHDNTNETTDEYDIQNLRFIKVLKIENRMINVIKSIDNIIVTANVKGEIHFYDNQLKLLYWIHGLGVDSIRRISFNMSPRSYKIFDTECKKPCCCWEKVEVQIDPLTGLKRQKLHLMKIPTDATISGKPLIIRDFIIQFRIYKKKISYLTLNHYWEAGYAVTTLMNGTLIRLDVIGQKVTLNDGICFVDYITEKVEKILPFRLAAATSMTVHPILPRVCLGFADGTVELFDFEKHKPMFVLNLRKHFTLEIPPKPDAIDLRVDKIVPSFSVSCIEFSPSGLHLACGMNNGDLIFLHPSSLDVMVKEPYKEARSSITLLSYSCDSLTLALADTGKTILVYKYDYTAFKWIFVGKHRSHFKDVVSLLFLPEKAEGAPEFNLLSIGKDRLMVEYDISSSSDDYLEIMSLDRIEQSATPTAAILWPTPPDLDPEIHRLDLPLILQATDEFKYKIINYATTMTLSTILGPRYETPVCRMQLIHYKKNKKEGGDPPSQYLLFTNKDIIGLQKLPLDGNPWKHVGMLGHPRKLLQVKYRDDLGMLFTIGDKDACMTQWAVNFRAAESGAASVGGDLDPYYCLIENQRPGWLFQEIRDLFYYVQILCQGTFSPALRRVKDYIPIDSLPDLMRALGFFPTEYAVENLLVEAKYKVYLQKPVAEIDFEEFVKLYLNHRPAFGVQFQRISFSFRNFANINKAGYTIPRDEFIKVLTTTGECFSRELAWYLLSILCGHSFEDRALLSEDDFSFLPEEITFNYFVNNIIGMQEMQDLSENYSHLDSMMSVHSRCTVTSDMSEDRFFEDLLLPPPF